MTRSFHKTINDKWSRTNQSVAVRCIHISCQTSLHYHTTLPYIHFEMEIGSDSIQFNSIQLNQSKHSILNVMWRRDNDRSIEASKHRSEAPITSIGYTIPTGLFIMQSLRNGTRPYKLLLDVLVQFYQSSLYVAPPPARSSSANNATMLIGDPGNLHYYAFY